jgi:hypothetical protein
VTFLQQGDFFTITLASTIISGYNQINPEGEAKHGDIGY